MHKKEKLEMILKKSSILQSSMMNLKSPERKQKQEQIQDFYNVLNGRSNGNKESKKINFYRFIIYQQNNLKNNKI